MRKRDELADPNSCLNRTADDEPIFVLCARDVLAPNAVDTWADFAEGQGVRSEKIAEARQLAERMREWQRSIPVASNAVVTEGSALKPDEVPAWVQTRAGSELDHLVSIIRFIPGESPTFFHSLYDARELLWKWALKWAFDMCQGRIAKDRRS